MLQQEVIEAQADRENRFPIVGNSPEGELSAARLLVGYLEAVAPSLYSCLEHGRIPVDMLH